MGDENSNNQTNADAQQTAGEGATQNEGVQARIDQLTAQNKLLMEQFAALQAQAAQSIIQQPPKSEEPQLDFLPKDATEEQREMFAGMFKQFAGLVDAKFSSIQNQLSSVNAPNEVKTLAAQMGLSDAVAERAAALYAGWKAKGLPFDAKSAVTFAAGEVTMTKPDPRANQVPNAVFRAPNPVPNVQPRSELPLPGNAQDLVDQYGVEGAWDMLSKRLGDKPI